MSKGKHKPEARLENWSVIGVTLFGDAYGHHNPRIKDGQFVQTSGLSAVSPAPVEGAKVETRNTVYVLGKAYDPNSK